MKRPLIIISFDGLSTNDITYLKSKVGFNRYLSEASGSGEVSSIYPSVTYAAHASIITGCYPNRHGIIDNTKVQPKHYQNPDWYWYKKDILVPTLYEAAKQNGYSVAALLWPTTGKADIDYNMPEIFSNRKWISQLMVSLYAGSPLYQAKMVQKHGKLRNGKKQPALDNFTFAATLTTIKDYQPDMLMVHFTDLDNIRHLYGHNSKEAYRALDRHDIRLDRLLDVLGEIEKYNDAYIVVLGDHSSVDVTHGLSINQKLIEWGFLEIDKKAFKQVKALGKSCDGSCYIYTYDQSICDDLRKKLQALQNAFKSHFAIYEHDQIIKRSADGKAFIMLEASSPYHFIDDITVDFITPIASISYYKGNKITAVHGFDPQKTTYDTIFYIRGTSIVQNVNLGRMCLIDIAPTLAELMNWSFTNCDGKSKALRLIRSEKQN